MIPRILLFSAAHFLASMAAAFLTYGMDLDQLRSRSALSRAAGIPHDVLWGPHDAILRALGPGAVTRPGVVPAVLVGNHLLWGIGLYALCRGVRAVRPKRGTSAS